MPPLIPFNFFRVFYFTPRVVSGAMLPAIAQTSRIYSRLGASPPEDSHHTLPHRERADALAVALEKFSREYPKGTRSGGQVLTPPGGGLLASMQSAARAGSPPSDWTTSTHSSESTTCDSGRIVVPLQFRSGGLLGRRILKPDESLEALIPEGFETLEFPPIHKPKQHSLPAGILGKVQRGMGLDGSVGHIAGFIQIVDDHGQVHQVYISWHPAEPPGFSPVKGMNADFISDLGIYGLPTAMADFHSLNLQRIITHLGSINLDTHGYSVIKQGEHDDSCVSIIDRTLLSDPRFRELEHAAGVHLPRFQPYSFFHNIVLRIAEYERSQQP